jgi:hypothetical protein
MYGSHSSVESVALIGGCAANRREDWNKGSNLAVVAISFIARFHFNIIQSMH